MLREQPLELGLVGLKERRPLEFEAPFDVSLEPAVAKVWGGAAPATAITPCSLGLREQRERIFRSRAHSSFETTFVSARQR
jgi:hypothetical protein